MTGRGAAPRTLLVLALLVLAAAGCSASRVFVHRDADLTLYRKVTVLSFTNLSGDPLAAGRVVRAFTTELAIAEPYQLVDPSQFMAELDRLGARPDGQGNYDPEKLRAAAAKLEVTGLIRGAVTEYQMRRSGSDEYPVLSFDAEMIDIATGNMVWRVSVSEKGRGRLPIVGGAGARTYGRVTQDACARAVGLLKGKAF